MRRDHRPNARSCRERRVGVVVLLGRRGRRHMPVALLFTWTECSAEESADSTPIMEGQREFTSYSMYRVMHSQFS